MIGSRLGARVYLPLHVATPTFNHSNYVLLRSTTLLVCCKSRLRCVSCTRLGPSHASAESAGGPLRLASSRSRVVLLLRSECVLVSASNERAVSLTLWLCRVCGGASCVRSAVAGEGDRGRPRTATPVVPVSGVPVRGSFSRTGTVQSTTLNASRSLTLSHIRSRAISVICLLSVTIRRKIPMR